MVHNFICRKKKNNQVKSLAIRIASKTPFVIGCSDRIMSGENDFRIARWWVFSQPSGYSLFALPNYLGYQVENHFLILNFFENDL